MSAQTQNTSTQSQRNDVEASFNTYRGFQAMHHIAETLANSTIIPEQFRTTIMVKDRYDNNAKKWLYKADQNPSGVSNCIVALNMAQRLGADPMMVMQNLYLIDGRPSWSSQFIIAAINSSGRYSPLRFEVTGGDQEIEIPYAITEWVYNKTLGKREPVESTQKAKVKNYTCVAWVIEKETGERLESSPISMELAVKEGWYQKNGSKWQTMPEQMLRYRAASFFGRIYAPDLLMGLRSTEEEQERIIDVTPEQNSAVVSTSNFKVIKSQILKAKSLNALEEIESAIYAISDETERNELIKLYKANVEKHQVTNVDVTESKKPEQNDAVKKVTSDELRKAFSSEINKADSLERLNTLKAEYSNSSDLTNEHKAYLEEAFLQRKEILSQGDIFDTQPQTDYAQVIIERIENCKTQDEINSIFTSLETDQDAANLTQEQRDQISNVADRCEAEIQG